MAKSADGSAPSSQSEAKKRKKKDEDDAPVYKWWLEPELPDGVKWRTLEHKGVMFPPDYTRLPPDVYLKYNGLPTLRCHPQCNRCRQQGRAERRGGGGGGCC